MDGTAYHDYALGRDCPSLGGHPSRHLKTIGVSGAVGQTTTSYLIPGVLAAGGCATGVLGRLGYFDGCRWRTAPDGTPSPDSLAQWMAKMVANRCSHAVLELAHDALAGQLLANIELDVACVTDAGLGNGFGPRPRRDERTAADLLDCLAPEGFAIVNIDDPAAESVLARIDGPVLTVGMTRPAEVTAEVVERFAGEQTFLLSIENETVPVRTRLTGKENVVSCLVAAAVGLVYGIDLPAIVRGLEAIERIPARLEGLERDRTKRAA
ncbi:MAG TPA: Mur ligase family protein [Pirellulales bacterium]|nr:Mur ligase family protein [Pirellulales bacterium]